MYKDLEIRSKIFHEVYEQENNRNNHETLSSGSVAINSINKDKSNDELKSIKRLQTMAFGKESDDDEHQLFTEIVPLNYNALEQVIRQRLDSPSNTSLLDLMLPYILDKLKKGIDLKEICELEIFWDESSQVYGMDYKTMFVCMIERYQHHQLYIISLIKKLGIALPFVYQWIVNEKLILKMPLRAYSDCLAIDCPMVISLGSPLIGKSSLLNKIYSAQFMTNRAGIINGGIDVLLSTSEFACGFTIFDIHDDACEQKHLLNILFTMMPLESCWILLQSISVDETKAIINMLKAFGINDNQLICIVRDSKDQTKLQIEKLMQNRTEHVLSIRKIEDNNAAFNSNLAVLREKLFKLTGIGHTAKKPDGIPPKTIDGNIYSEIENRAVREQDTHIHIDIRDESVRQISLSIDKELKNIDAQMNNLQNNLFPHVELNNRIQAQECKKSELVGKEPEEKQAELTKIDQEIVRLSKKKASTKPSNLISRYNKLFIEGSFHLISELDKRVSAWQSPIMSPLFRQRDEIVINLENLRTSIAKLRETDNNSEQLRKHEENEREFEKEKQKNSKSIDDKIINRDIFMRELLAIYGDKKFFESENSEPGNSNPQFKCNFKIDAYINSLSEYMIKGNEIELIDGDNNNFNSDIVSQIFKKIDTKYRKDNEEPPFVVSVIGPQSTGKSTLLNMLFGSNFLTSAGRCTKGLYASLFTTKYPKASTFLVLDTEGLLSVEKANEEYDKKLTLFCIACSQIILINLNGEVNTAMKKVLSISVFVANQLRVLRIRPMIMFVLRNMMDLDVNKQKETINNVKKELKEISKLSGLELSQVLNFQEEKAFFLMFTAFNKDFVYNKGKELFQQSRTNFKFATLTLELREKIFNEANTSQLMFRSLSDWVKRASEIWKTIDLYDNLMMIESIKEINERKELSDIMTNIIQTNIEPIDGETSFRSKLEKILTNDPIPTDVEAQFDSLKKGFEEKVLQRFKNETRSKSYLEKLIKEYKDRLLSVIRTTHTQAIQKYKEIAEKNRLKCILDNALIDIQNRMEVRIVEWQKVQQKSSDKKKKEEKQRIISEFNQFMESTKQKTEADMNKNKKSRDQWGHFVQNQIVSVLGTIPVEKQFFSIQKLEQIQSKTTLSTNIIDIISDSSARSIYYERKASSESSSQDFSRNSEVRSIENPRNDSSHYTRKNAILEKIPSLIQQKRPCLPVHEKSCKSSATDSYCRQIYTEIEKKKWINGKLKTFILWVLDNVLFKLLARDMKTMKDTTPAEENSYIKKIDDVGIRSEALFNILSLFLEINEYLQTTIKQEITNSKEYQITSLKQDILQIKAKITEIDQKYLNEENLEFTHDFGNEVIEWLYKIIVDKMFDDQETNYNSMWKQFEEDVNKLLEELRKRLDAAFGDADNATDMATKLFDEINNICLSKLNVDYQKDLEKETQLNPDKLTELSNEVFKQPKEKGFDKDGIYKYITNMVDYMKETYSKHFENKADAIENIYKENYAAMYEKQCSQLQNKLEDLESIFTTYQWNEYHVDRHKTQFAKFFKAYIEGTINDSLINSYLTGELYLPYKHSDRTLLEPLQLFQRISISIYTINNPKVFLAAVKNTLKSLHKKIDANEIQFNLTDDMRKEKDKIKASNQEKALGCMEQCPYCGCKCTDITKDHEDHHSDNHRLMAFKGSFEMLKNGKKGFVFDLCNSNFNIKNGRWKATSISQTVVRENQLIRERMSKYSVGEGDVTITLAWFDSNDLDLHVTCPCGTELYFGNKNCPTCAGYLDLDMNVCNHGNSCPDNKCSSKTPTENVFFKPAKEGVYRVSVHYFSGPKGTAGLSSAYQIRVQTHANKDIRTFSGCVEANTERRHVNVGDFDHSVSISFLEHVKKNFPSWSNIREVSDRQWENVLKKAWWQVDERMSDYYGYENNTPKEFETITY